MPKRTRSRSRVDFSRAVKTARKTGTVSSVSKARRARAYYKLRPTVIQKVNNLYRMIETKEGSRKSDVNIALAHNNVLVVKDVVTDAALNPFTLAYGTDDPMAQSSGARVGDYISIKGLMIKGFFENALARPKVYYRVMLLKGAKGDTFSRATIFKNDSNNKMIDQLNTERFTVVAQKIFNISASNVAASGTEAANGAPIIAQAGGVGTRTFKMWVPGSKFGNNGNLQFENGSSQPKFYDYRICILVYDWYGTPQDVNNVGRINELYTKLYFKDA